MPHQSMRAISSGCPSVAARQRKGGVGRRQREGGYLLLAIMLMMAFMVITLAYVVGPNMVQQMKRDREEEMIHRGTEYARAIKKFYKKNGRYPSSLDDLDKGQIRYLRKRYTDPLVKDGKWKLLHYGDIQTLLNSAAPGTPAALGQQGGALTPGGALPQATGSGFGGSTFGSQGFGAQAPPLQQQQLGAQQNPGLVGGFNSNSNQGGNPEGAPSGSFGVSTSSSTGDNQQAGSGADQQGGNGSNQPGSPFSSPGQNSSSSGGSQVFGGGAIVGVASVDKEKTIRIYNKKKTYDEWQFIYNPVMDQQNVLLRGPYQPTTYGNTNIGTPAGQLNQQNGQQNSPFGNNGGFGQNNSSQPGNTFGQPTNSGFGQQNNFPPDQTQQH